MRIAILAALFLSVTSWSARADDDDDRLPAGIMPISQLIGLLERALGGEIAEIEFEEDDLIYEVYHVDRSGRRTELEVDARTGRILKREVDD